MKTEHVLWNIGRATIHLWLLTSLTFIATNGNLYAVPPAGYYQVWADEFNGSSLDSTKWSYRALGLRGDAYEVTNAVSLDGSNLVITVYTSGGTNFEGMISTSGKFHVKYGYLEARAAFHDTNGMSSAVWLQSPTIGTYLGYPAYSGTEIDVCEHRRIFSPNGQVAVDRIQANLHWDGYGIYEGNASSGDIGGSMGTNFHTFALNWTATNYTVLYDDVPLWNTNVSVSQRSEYFILSSDVKNGGWGGPIPAGGYPDLGTSSVRLLVDYVRYYAPTTTFFWSGGVSTDWGNSGNWIANLLPATAGDIVFSYLSTNTSTTLPQNYGVNSLSIMETPASVALTNNTLTVGAGGIDLVSATHDLTLNSRLVLGADQIWIVGTNRNITMNGELAGTANLITDGYGTVNLSGSNSFTGSTTVNNGTLSISGNLAGGGDVTVNKGVLTGNGTISGNVTIQSGGTLSPGTNSIGTLTADNVVTLQGTTVMKLYKALKTNDVIQEMATINYGGTLMLTNLGGTLATNDSFRLFYATNYSGTFANIAPPVPGSGLAWDLTGMTNGTLKVTKAPQPQLGGIIMAGTNVIIPGSNGIANATFYVLASTNLLLPLTNWSILTTGIFSPNGSFILTNALDPAFSSQFYLLQLP